MSVIWGIFGKPADATMTQMQAALLHRHGGGSITIVSGDSHCLAYGGAAATGGAYRHNDLSVAYSGRFFGACSTLTAKDLHLSWSERGSAMLEDLTGEFTIAIVDKGVLTLVRDGAGHRSIYYGTHAGQTYFASETKAIVAVPSFPRELRPAAVAQYLSYSFVPDGGTMLRHVYDLPAGHLATFTHAQSAKILSWFHGSIPNEKRTTPAQIQTIISDSVRERIPAQKPFAVYLSGGLDSSLVAAELAKHTTSRIPSYTIHFGTKYPHELSFAKEVAKQVGTDHHEIEISPRAFLPRLREMIWRLDTPIGDPITMPNFELGRVVGQEVSTIFNGEGGDPLFGGPKNFSMLLHHWYGGIERPPRFREQAYLQSYRRAYGDLDQLLHPEFRTRCNLPDSIETPLTPFFERPDCSFLDKLMAINTQLKGAHLILPKVERMAAASGLSVCSPLFDDRLVNASFGLPGTQKLSRGIEKIVLKDLYRDCLPPSVINRPKSGMRVPVHYWFQGDLKRYAKKILSPKQLEQSGIFNPDRVQQYLKYADGPGLGRYGLRLWMILTLELYHRIIIQGEPV